MSVRHSLPLLLAASFLVAGQAHSQTADAAMPGKRVNVYQYAVDNPVSDSRLNIAPTLGETVPNSIELVALDGEATYAYFYYQGQPVIVDMKTRSVVRVGR